MASTLWASYGANNLETVYFWRLLLFQLKYLRFFRHNEIVCLAFTFTSTTTQTDKNRLIKTIWFLWTAEHSFDEHKRQNYSHPVCSMHSTDVENSIYGENTKFNLTREHAAGIVVRFTISKETKMREMWIWSAIKIRDGHELTTNSILNTSVEIEWEDGQLSHDIFWLECELHFIGSRIFIFHPHRTFVGIYYSIRMRHFSQIQSEFFLQKQSTQWTDPVSNRA